MNVVSEEILDIKNQNIRTALKHMKNDNNQQNVQNGQIFTLVKSLKIVFNKYLNKGKIPENWRSPEVILMHKNADDTNIDNYRPIVSG